MTEPYVSASADLADSETNSETQQYWESLGLSERNYADNLITNFGSALVDKPIYLSSMKAIYLYISSTAGSTRSVRYIDL